MASEPQRELIFADEYANYEAAKISFEKANAFKESREAKLVFEERRLTP